MKKILFIVILILHVNANDDILTQHLKKDFDLKQDQINKSSDSLKNSWIDPIILSVQKSKNKNNSKMGSEDFLGFNISISQDIFRSGGIFYAIKYADAVRNLGLKSLKKEHADKVISAYLLLVKILKNDKMQFQKSLNIENAKLNIKRKKEQYLAGLIDVTLLNDAILEKIANENALLGLQDVKNELLLNFKSLSDKKYHNIKLPHVKVPTKNEYLSKNISLIVGKRESENKKYLSKLTKANYLPKLTLNASYNVNKINTKDIELKDDFYNYGIRLSMPLSIKSFDDIESSRLKYLISKNQEQILFQNLKKKYEKIENDLKNIDKKIDLAKENLKIYNTLLTQTKELVKAQIKIEDDLVIMKNSKKIRELQLQIHNLEKDEKSLELYKDFMGNIF